MEIRLPASYEDITIEQARKDQGREMSAYERVLIYGNLSAKELREIPYNAIERANEHLLEITNTPIKKFFKEIEHQGKVYQFIPDWAQFTTGEYMDCEEYLKDPIENAHKLMSIWYREPDGLNRVKPYEGSHERFRDVPYCYFEGCLLFFWTTRNNYLRTSLQSLAKVAGARQLQVSGGGITRFRRWLITTLKKLRG
jgi:hypothetical protein